MIRPLLPSFVIAGFECSTPINRDHRRIDELALTQHDRFVREDYRCMRELGVHAVRDGVRWNLVDQGQGRHDFSSVVPFLEAADAEGMTVIWDLFHYGYPDDLDPFSDDFIIRFADYCYDFARLVNARSLAVPFYTPINEISYFAWVAGDQATFAPHAAGRGPELKRQLARASIAGMDAIMSVDSRARFVHADPLVKVVAPRDANWLHGEAEHFNYHFVHEAWDMLGGAKEPALGGSLRHLDIVGVNYYGYNQWEHTRPLSIVGPADPRHTPFGDLLIQVYERYRRPIIVSETSSHGDLRAGWLRDIGDECLRALRAGVELQGLCLYPVIDMFDWHSGGEPLGMGLFDLYRAANDSGRWQRVLHSPMAEALRELNAKVEAMVPHYRSTSKPPTLRR